MATVAEALPQLSALLTWLRGFLKEELAPYPGRAALVARMVIATTLITIVGMTFQIPFTYQGTIYALLISREGPRATLKSAGTIFLVTGIGAAYLLISVALVIGYPLLHFLWTISAFFLAFYLISALKDYTAAVVFAVMIAIGTPLWDRIVRTETNVEDTLWLCLSVVVGIVITGAVELVFANRRPGDDIVLPISERLSAIKTLLTCYADGRPIDAATKDRIIQLEMRGTSLLRRVLQRSGSSHNSVEIAGVVALVGRLVDLAAVLTQLRVEASVRDQRRFRKLAAALASIRKELVNRRIPGPLEFNTDAEPTGVPLLPEIEHTVSLIPHVFVASRSNQEYLPSEDNTPLRPSLLASDAFANPDHLRFALKGCLAASICYVFYNVVAWPGISTSVTTCLLTALSTIGSSRQKQILRITGAVVGGFLLGMGSQIFVLPHLDSIGGFVLLLIPVTALASWFMTSSPRLSYFGLQVAVAFYLINLSEFKMQTSLAVARDRVVGVLIGLSVMWLVFDRIWGAPAGIEMRKTFISNLRLLAQFAKEPLSPNSKTAFARNLALRETLNANLDQVRALGDGVLFEFGPSREQDLALRHQIRRWQPELRMIFITLIATWKYRARLPGFELPETLVVKQQEFDNDLARALDATAERMEGRSSENEPRLEKSLADLERVVRSFRPGESEVMSAARLHAFLLLHRRIESLMISLEQQI